MYLIVGGLVVLLLVTAGTTTAIRLRLNEAGDVLADTLRPAQIAAANLTKSYVDEETGERGYLLTKDTSLLQPYYSGEQDTANTHNDLARYFAGDAKSLAVLAQVNQAANAWRIEVVDPEISAFQTGRLVGPALVTSVSLGKAMFDQLRVTLSALQDRINQLVNNALQESNSLQRTANDVTIAAAIAAAVLAGVAIWQLRTSFAVPISSLLTQVRRVSSGDLDHSVDVTGPLELTTIARTVEAMRVRILTESARSATVGRQLARYEEAERIASSLGDTVIRQLFTTSLTLQSTASRYPSVAGVLSGVITDLDRALKDLQSAIFELTSAPSPQPLGNQVLDLVDQLEAGLGAAPDVQFAGSMDSDRLRPLVPDVVAVVREMLAAVVRPAAPGESSVSVAVDDGELHLRITGAPSADGELVGVRRRAEELGGSCSVARDADAMTVDWRIPLPALTPPATSRDGDS